MVNTIINVDNIEQCKSGMPVKIDDVQNLCQDGISFNEFDCNQIQNENYIRTLEGICYNKDDLLNAIKSSNNLFTDPMDPKFKLVNKIEDIEEYKKLLDQEYTKIYDNMIKILNTYTNFFVMLNSKNYFGLLKTIAYVFMDVGIYSKNFIDKIIKPIYGDTLINSSFYKKLELDISNIDENKLISDPECQWQLLLEKERGHFFETPSKYNEFLIKYRNFYITLLTLDKSILQKDLIQKIIEYEKTNQSIYEKINETLLQSKQNLLGLLTENMMNGLIDTDPNKILYNNIVYDKVPDNVPDNVKQIIKQFMLVGSDFMGCVKGLGATILKKIKFAEDLFKLSTIQKINTTNVDEATFNQIIDNYLKTMPDVIQYGGNNINYKNKYLKYKQKYINLKKLI